jgi:hypothetical protein
MFRGCTNLTTAPELPATTLADSCYYAMFRGCSKLNYIKMLATDISTYSCLNNWVNGVSSTGIFIKNPAMTILPTGASGIPSGWTVVNDGEESGLTFPVTLVEGDNGYLGIDFYNYVVENKYNDEEVYVIKNGYVVATYNWCLNSNNEIECIEYEVIDATNGVGSPGLSDMCLTSNGNLYFYK